LTPDRPPRARASGRARIDLVVNRRAKRYAREPRLLDQVRDCARGRAEVHVTASLEELDHVTRALAARGTDLVLLAGGDGSLMAGATALADAFAPDPPPPLAPVPGGTAGTVARNWGLGGDPVRALARLLGPRRIERRPSLHVEVDGGGVPLRRVGFIAGTGLVASFFALYYERGAPGYGGSALLVARIFAESFWGGPLARRVLEPLPCALEVDGERLAPEAWSLVCAAVVRDLGIHMLVTHRGGEDPARPHLVATPLCPRRLGPRAPRVLAGRPIGGAGSVDRLVERFVVRFAPRGAFVLDGEIIDAQAFSVCAGPELRVALPA
jgi:diacylglycerol kinase family enzyme